MRRIAGGVLVLLALLTVLVGAAMAVLLGPDDRAVTGPHAVDADGVAVVTAPGVISWAGPTVSVTAEVADDRPVFVGVGNSVDVEDYVGETERLVVDSYEVPWSITTSREDGKPNLPASPTALDWWIEDGAGLGGASITFALPDETVSLAILSVGANDLKGLTVTTSYDVRGGFGIGLGLVAVGVGGALLGWVVVRRRPLLRRRPVAARYEAGVPDDRPDDRSEERPDGWAQESDPAEPDEGAEPLVPTAARGDVEVDGEDEVDGGEVAEEVVYVYVDERGVEHEIPAEEAHGYEVVEETELPSDSTVGPREKGAGGRTSWWRRR
ncbi:MAG: hypothetical protein ACRDO8_11230 [Nocardioidaceae bacterium]